jgi:TonB family protein
MTSFLAMMLLALAEAITVVSPAYPPDAIEGGTVVALLQVSNGEVRGIQITQADPPFADAVQSALSRWRFRDSETGSILVVVNFRSPRLYATATHTRALQITEAPPGSPYPLRLMEPPYPANSVAEGSVILRLELNEAGEITRTKTLQGLGGLTSAAVATVRKWRFEPARDAKGTPRRGEAYAVCVFRRPVL